MFKKLFFTAFLVVNLGLMTNLQSEQSVSLWPKLVYQRDSATFSYVKGEMPNVPSFTIDIPEEKALKMSEREQQVERLQHQLSSVELTKFCEFLKAKTSTSAVFVFKGVPLGVDVVFNEEKTVVTMYGQWEEAPKNLVRMARTCVQRRGWFVLNGANAVSTAGLMSLMAIVGSLVIGLVAAGSGGGCDDPTFDPGEGNGFQQMLSWPMRFLILNSNGSCNRGRLAKTGVSFFVLFWMTIVFGLIDSKIQA